MMYEPGLYTIYGGPESGIREDAAEIDVVAVHGLNFKNNPKHARATWTSQGSIWIRDFLPSRLRRPCRVMLFAYNSSPAMGAAAMRLDEHAKTLLQCLMAHRKDAPERPLLFLCHSLGGIVVKSALVEATLDPSYRLIVQSTRLLVFFATPHLGGNYSAIGDIAAKIVRAGLRTPGNDLLDGLKAGSRDVIRRFEQSRHLPEGCLVISFYETENYGRLGLIVEKASAILNLPEDREKQIALQANHSKVCKFPTADSCQPVMDLIVTELDRALELHMALEPKPENIHWLVTRSASSLFTGRDDIVEKILKLIEPSSKPQTIRQQRFVLTGLGGQGKSEVCLNVVQKLRPQFWGVFWVDVGTKAAATRGFTKIARMLGSEAKDIDDILILLSNCPASQNWLLVLDNADDMETDYQEYIPSGTRGAVLMTSRLADCRFHSTVGHEELGNLKKEDCVSLLFKIMGTPEDSQAESVPAAEAIAEEMGFHTLALLQAGAYIAAGHCSMASYPREYRQQQDELLKFGLSQSQSRYRNVYATFEVSIHSLASSQRESARYAPVLLELFSTLHYQDIPVGFFEDAWRGARIAQANAESDTAIDHLTRWHVSRVPEFLGAYEGDWNDERFSSIVDELISLSLVQRSQIGGETILSLHPLIHGWLSTRQDEVQRSVCVESSACLLALAQFSRQKWQPHIDRLGPHLIALTSSQSLAMNEDTSRHIIQMNLKICELMHKLRCDEEATPLIDGMLRHFNVTPETPTQELLPLFSVMSLIQYSRGDIQQAINTIERVREIQRSSLDELHADRIGTEVELARAYHTNGQWVESIHILERVRDIHEQQFKFRKDHPDRLSVIHQLGGVYMTSGRVKEAIALLQEVVSIQDSTKERGDPISISSKYELASAYLYDCQMKEAVEIFEDLNATQAAYLPDNHPDRLDVQDGLADAYLENGQLKEAIALLEKTCEIRSSSLKEDSPRRLLAEQLLGSAYRRNGQSQEAVNILQRALSLSNDRENHPHRIALQSDLGKAYLANGQIKDAIEILENLDAMEDNPIDSNHPRRLGLNFTLGSAYIANGETEKAINLLGKVIQGQRLTLDEAHPNLLASHLGLGTAYLNNGQVKRAIEIFERVVQVNSTSNTLYDHELASRHELGRAYLANGQYKDAVHIFEDVVDKKNTLFHNKHPERLASMHELARAYLANGAIKKSIQICEEVVEIQESTLQQGHPDQFESQRLLGSAYLSDNQTKRAMAIFKKVDDAERVVWGENHPNRLASQNQLAAAYMKAGQVGEAISILKEANKVAQDRLAESHPTRRAVEYQLASAYLNNDQTQEGISLLQAIILSFGNLSDEKSDPSRLKALHQLGFAYMKLSQPEQAVLLLEEVVNIRSELNLGESDQSHLVSQHELGCCYLSLGRVGEAISILKEVVRIESSTLSSDDPSRATSQTHLGTAYLKNGMAPEAVATLKEVVLMRRRYLGESDPARLQSEHDLGLAYLENGEGKKGVAILEETLDIERRFLDQSHALRLKTQYELSCAYLDMGKAEQAIALLENMAQIIKKWRPEDKYPTQKELQETLAKAYKANKLKSRLLALVGLKKA